MRGQRIIADPLWECLCPSWYPPLRSTTALRIRTNTARLTKHRSFATTSSRNAFGKFDASIRGPRHEPGAKRIAHTKSVHELYVRLKDAAVKAEYNKCREIAEELVGEHGEKPSVEIYDSLILSNVNQAFGAAWRVQKLLEEMELNGLEMTNETCHIVLKVLAVHPDHLLRADVLGYMQEKWFYLDKQGWCDVAVGYWREACFEMALATMDSMREADVPIPAWLLDMGIYMLVDAGEIDQAYRMLRERWNAGELDISMTLWHYCLDLASAARHLPMSEFIWRTHVERDLIGASSGISINVMSTAAKHGDPALATSVFQYITARGEPTKTIHYQLLIDAYMHQTEPDLEKALGVLSVMSLERLRPTVWQTRAIFAYLKNKNIQEVDRAWEILRRLKHEGKSIPLVMLNTILESYIAHNDLDAAIKVYKQLHSFGGAGKPHADIETINTLLLGCRESNADTASVQFVLSEMEALNLAPEAITFDRLMLIYILLAERSLRAGNVDDALDNLENTMRYYNACRETGLSPRYRTTESFAFLLAELDDPRCWDVFQNAVAADVGSVGHELKVRAGSEKIKDRLSRAVENGADLTTERPQQSVSTA